MRDKIKKGPVNADLALKWITQVATALLYLHQVHHIHRDVKPENILIDSNDNAILADLGVISSNLNAGTYAGDRPYMAREIIKAAVDINTTYNNKVDVWSLGLTFAELLTGKLHKVDNRDDREYPIPYKEGVSKELIDLCSLMIRKETNSRPFLH